MRLLLSCSELGLGHASRIMSLGERLKAKGHDLYFFAGGKAFQLLRNEFSNVYPCTPIAWYETAHGIITSASLINILFPLPHFNHETKEFRIKNSNAIETIDRYYDLRRHIQKIRPDLIVSDGDLLALRLASRWKKPSVYITNLIRPSYGFSAFLNPGERFIERYLKHCSKIIIPDNPPPYTICEYNLGNLHDVGIDDKVEFVGSFLNIKCTPGSGEHVFAPISGPYGTRAKLTKIILSLLEEAETKSIISLGAPGTNITVKRGKSEIHAWLSSRQRQEYMKKAKLVIFSGGHRTCFETIKFAKPSICIPTQPEQRGNSAKLQNLVCSISIKNKQELWSAFKKIEENYQLFQRKIEALNIISSRFRGLQRAAEIIENSAS